MPRFLIALALLIPILATPLAASTPDEDRALRAGYAQALAARGAGRPDIAEDILRRLISLRPNVVQLRFDLGVALAEQGQCIAAHRAFDTAAKLSGTPSFDRERDRAMGDLCPKLAPWEINGSFDLVYDSNGTNGATNPHFTLGGIPFTLGGSAVAKEIYGFRATGSVAYNVSLGESSYLVPSVGLSYADYNLDEHDSLTTTIGLAYRFKGDRVDWRIGPQAVLGYTHDGLETLGVGLSARAAITLTPRSGLFLSGSALRIENESNELLDYDQTSLGATYIRQIKGSSARVSAGVSLLSQDYRDDFQDLDSVDFHAGLSGTLAPKIGYQLKLSHRINQGREENYLFGTKRNDNVTTVSGLVSFARFEGWYGRPYVGVSHTVSDSNWPSKAFDKTRLRLGLTRSF